MSGMAKAERLAEIKRLYIQRAYTDIDLAKRLGVARETIYRDRVELTREYPIEKDDEGRYRINRSKLISEIKVNLHEALVLYLAARKSSRQTRIHQPHVASAVEKLAATLRQPMTERLLKVADGLLKQDKVPEKIKIMETITQAWVEQHKVRIRYQGLKSKGVTNHLISPYFIEPSIWSDSIYVVAYSDVFEKIIPFKIDRIDTAILSGERFELPTDFDEQELLRYAWGIWKSDSEPEQVVLKFAPGEATKRVKESIWHPQQKPIKDTPDGGCLWEAPIAEWREMLPWIRGWGADVEVLEPEKLRNAIKNHIYKSTQVYEITTNTASITARLLRLWGKTTKDSEVFHPALYHMLDVAHIAQQLLSSRSTPRWRQVLSHTLGTDAEGLREWLPYLIALHDIGKLSVPFQVLNQKQMTRLRSEGFNFGKAEKRDGVALRHPIVGRILLSSMPFIQNWSENFKLAFLEMVSGHHGIYQAETMKDEKRLEMLQEAPEWQKLRQHAMQILESHLCLKCPESPPEPENISAAIAALNGFCILCDWLGSDQDYFPAKPYMPLDEYVINSRERAYKRVKDVGFFQSAVSDAPTNFVDLFSFLPRPLQIAIGDIPESLLFSPTLTIVEAPTGEGKTEAALALARRIATLRGTDEMYIALPTTATSNAMYDRITKHLQDGLNLDPNMVQLIHGQSFLHNEHEKNDLFINPLENGDGEERFARDWFAPKKKALLAPFGVGTIDQAELSALNVRHNALRLIGLAGKVVILDEVHAYDTYMTTIIKRMLSWLSALGSSVILLSATLPTQKRQELAEAFSGDIAHQLTNLNAYPNLLTIGKEVYSPKNSINVYQPNKKIELSELNFTDKQASEKAEWLLNQIQSGGCACWITNTVTRAQAISKELQSIAPNDVKLTLLHSRFPQEGRSKLETDILSQYSNGEDTNRPSKGIVVGTQVLEQSLDLDFDVMATDLAPVDLLLQRAGRLHRHDRNRNVRHSHKTPHLYINTVTTSADKGIYGEYILEMTKQALEKQLNNKTPLTLPADYRTLVEFVYTPDIPDRSSPLYALWDKMDIKAEELENEAEDRLTSSPDPFYPFYRNAKVKGFEEDEDSNAWFVAQTRWGQESVTVIPLMRVGETAVPILSSDISPIPLNQSANRETQRRLRLRGIRISNHSLVKALKNEKAEKTYKLFTGSTLLKQCVPLWLKSINDRSLIFYNDDLPKPVYLHPVTGLVFGKYDESTDK